MTDPFRAPLRRALLDLVIAEPGIRLAEAARRLDCAPKNLCYHLRVLSSAGLAEKRKRGRQVRLYPSKPARLPAHHHQILDNPFNRAVLEVVASHPGIPRQGIAQALGVTPARLTRRIAMMQEAGILTCQREALTINHFPTEQALEALMALGD